jgi:hypothetical protein
MPSYTENALQAAINAVNSGEKLRCVARDYGIPLATLHNRMNGREPRKVAHTFQQRLSIAQEAHLVNWIKVQIALGVPPSHAQIRALAS